MRTQAPDETHIYLIGTPEGPKKVGLAADITKRMRSIQTGSPVKLEILHSRKVDTIISSRVELRAHFLLRDRRLHGEWFDAPLQEAVKAIDNAVDTRGDGELASSSVGRPSLGMRETKVRISPLAKKRIVALVGKNRMAAFIREAVLEQLAIVEAAKRED